MKRLTLKRLDTGWWVLGPAETDAIGPYATRADAVEARKGLVAFYQEVKKR